MSDQEETAPSSLRRAADHLPPDLAVALVSIEGELRLIRQEQRSNFNELTRSIMNGDAQNAQAIVGLQSQVDTLRIEAAAAVVEYHKDAKDRDDRIDANRRLVFTAIVAPFIVLVLAALVLAAFHVGGA